MADIIIDGGTTNLRVYLIDGSGSIIASEKAEGGVKYTAIDGNNSRLKVMLRECLEAVLKKASLGYGDIGRCVAFGMITSGLGLLEIPHLAAPAGVEELRAGMQKARFEDICPLEIEFIPGVRNFKGSVDTENVSGMDMMRGEETESMGLYSLMGLKKEALLVLPGSHNKFVHISAEGKILGCMTSISGELLDAITHHTILSGSVGGSFCSAEEYSSELALAGAAECEKSGIGRAAFAGRILGLLGSADRASVQSYLLGAVLYEDYKAMKSFSGLSEGLEIIVAGKDPVRQALCDILASRGCKNTGTVSPETAAAAGIAGAVKIAFGN